MPEEPRYRVEPLSSEHSTRAFTCGDPELDEYLRDEALDDMARGVARTFVAVHVVAQPTDQVVGFYALRAHAATIDEQFFDDLDDSNDDSDDTGVRMIEVPLVELMYLGRDRRVRGIGIGDFLMIDALRTVAPARPIVSVSLGSIFVRHRRGYRYMNGSIFSPFGSTRIMIALASYIQSA